MRILITGGAGFIGSHLANLLHEQGHSVRIFDGLLPQVHGNPAHPAQGVKWPEHLHPKIECVHGMMRMRRTLRRALEGVECVVHLAARVGVGQSAYQEIPYYESNVFGTAILLQEIRENAPGVVRLIVAGSMSSYGEGAYINPVSVAGLTKAVNLPAEGLPEGWVPRVHPPLRSMEQMQAGEWEQQIDGQPLSPVGIQEGAALRPASLYASTKAEQERMCLIWGEQQGVQVVACRFFNVYGEYQALSNPYTGVAAIFSAAVKQGRAPVVYEDGKQSRDFVYVGDVARIVGWLSTEEHDFTGPINVGTGKATTIGELAECIALLHDSDLSPEITGAFRQGDVRHCIADVSLLEEMGIAAEVSLAEGLSRLHAWSTEQEVAEALPDPHAELAERGLLYGMPDAPPAPESEEMAEPAEE